MARRKRRKFTADFKADAVRLCTVGRQSIVQVPISLDRRVLPEAVDGDVAALDLMATVVPASAAAAAIGALRGWELFDQAVPLEPEWERLGYDICDAHGTSSLTNCGYEPGERESLLNFVPQLNEHHLFREIEDADHFRVASDLRVPEHAPFAVSFTTKRV
ncbi:MAG TPA: hypothetical protein VF331_14250 [Polyangiales bacterium]